MFRQVNTRYRPFRSANTSRERGAIAVFAAILMTVAAAAAGAAVDFGQAYYLKARLQQMAETAVLAAGSQGEYRTEEQLKAVANRYLAVNSIPASLGSVTSDGDFNESTRVFTVTLTAEMRTMFLGILGKNNLTIVASAGALKKTPGPLDVVLVLDQTTSMAFELTTAENDVPDFTRTTNPTRIDALKYAATDFLNSLRVSDDVLLGVVPFGLYVSIPKEQYEDEPWLKETSTVSTAAWNGCLGIRGVIDAVDYAVTIDGTDIEQYPMRQCNGSKVLALTKISVEDNYSRALGTISEIGGQSASFLPSGLVWGWNLLTSDAPYTEARTQVEVETKGVRKVLVLMSDGGNNAKPLVSGDGKRSGGVGVITPEEQGQTGGSVADALQKTLCTNMKRATPSIEVFTVLYGGDLGGGALSNTINAMKDCSSSTPATEDHFVHASSVRQLKNAFQNITDRITTVRLVN